MQIIKCEQGSDEWFEARSGVITASMFSTIRKLVGALTGQQSAYVDAVLSGKTDKEAQVTAGS